MHHVVPKVADIPVSVHKESGSFAMHLPFVKLAIIARLVRPDHNSSSTHVVVLELTFVKLPSVSEIVLSESVELAIQEFSLVETTFELEATFA